MSRATKTSLLSTNTREGLLQGRARVANQELSTHSLELRSLTCQEVVETVSLLGGAEPHTAGTGSADIEP